MQGPEGAAATARTWLTARLPARLRIIEARLDLPAGTLPDPVHVLDHEVGPLGLEDWPSVFVLPQGSTGMRLVEVRPDAAEVYRVTYALRLLAWVRADNYPETDQLRKRYALALREALLERKALPAAATYGEATVVDPASIREDYSDVFTDEAKRTIAGVMVDVALIAHETLAGPDALGIVETVEVRETGDTAAVPPHPAL